MSRPRKALLVIATPVLLLSIALAAGHDYVRGAAFVVRAAGLQGSPRTVADWTTSDVTESDRPITWRGGTLRGRLYRAASDGAVPVLVVPGVHAGGIDEPRLIKFAQDVAATGRHVVTAELSDLKAYRITARTTDMIEDAALWLSTQSGLAADGRVGMMGISFAGGLSIVAAARPALRDRVAFVMSFGGHGDLPRTLQYLCTGTHPAGASKPPHDYGVAIILLGVTERVVPAVQVQPLRDAIQQFLHASHVDMWDKPQAQIEFGRARTMAGALPEPARTLMTYVNDRNVATLGPILLPHVKEMASDPALSPARIPPVPFPVYLLHGTDDNVIPAAESRQLAQALSYGGSEVHQLTTPLITHAEVDKSAAARAVWEMVSFWAYLLDET